MTTYNLSTPVLRDCGPAVNNGTPDGRSTTDDVNAREDRLLRIGNGIRDDVAFPRLRAMGVSETDLHRTAMHLCRRLQGGRDVDGVIADLLGVTRAGINGTVATSEVV